MPSHVIELGLDSPHRRRLGEASLPRTYDASALGSQAAGAKFPDISSKIVPGQVSYMVNMVSAHDQEDAGQVK
jgi:hypothetical protein